MLEGGSAFVSDTIKRSSGRFRLFRGQEGRIVSLDDTLSAKRRNGIFAGENRLLHFRFGFDERQFFKDTFIQLKKNKKKMFKNVIFMG